MGYRVSVIIPVYNCEKTLDKCIESIINQTYGNLEILLINDGSKDKSLEKCMSFKEKDERIIVINKENGGPSSARNYGIEKATGDFIFFIDSDDYIDLNCIENLINNYSEEYVIALKHKEVYDDKVVNKAYNNRYFLEEFQSEFLKGNVGGFVWGILFKKEIIGNRKFDENTSLMEDCIFLFDYLNNKNEIRFLDDCYYYYSQNNDSITTICDPKKIKKNIIGFDYSLEKISNIINISKENEELIKNKKFTLLRYEFKKIKNIKNLRIILKDEKVKTIIKKYIKELNGIKKFYLSCYNRKIYIPFFLEKIKNK